MCRAFLRFSDVANLIVFATWRLGPLQRSVQDTGDLNRFLSDAVNNDERQARDNHFPRVGLPFRSGPINGVACLPRLPEVPPGQKLYPVWRLEELH